MPTHQNNPNKKNDEISRFLKVIKFLKAPTPPNSSLEEKLKSLGKSPNAAKKK